MMSSKSADLKEKGHELAITRGCRTQPIHRRGVTSFPGIYFLGLRWLYERKSFFLRMAAPLRTDLSRRTYQE
jgi:hypothetical protein